MNRKIVLSALVVLVLSLTTVAAPAQSGEIAAVIEIKSINKLISDIDTVAKTLVLTSQREKIIGGLETMIGSSGLVGLDSNKIVRAYVILPEKKPDTSPALPTGAKPSVVLVMPLTDNGKMYLESAGKFFERSEQIRASYHFSGPHLQKPGVSSDLCVAIANGKAVVGKELNCVELIADRIKKGNVEIAALQPLPGTVRVGIDVQACLAMLEKGISQSTAAMKQRPAPNRPGMKIDPAKIVEAEGEALLGILREVKSFTIGARVRRKTMDIYTRLAPMPKTKLAGILKKLDTPSEKYLSLLPADTFLAVAGTGMAVIDDIAEPYCDLLDKIYAAMGPEMTNMSALVRKSVTDIKGMYSGEYAIGVVPGADGKGVGLVEVIGLNDPVKAQKLMEETFSTWNETYGKMIPGSSMTVNEPRTYRGVKILSYAYSVDPQAGPAAQTPRPIPLPRWLNNLKWEMAFAGNDMIYTMGPPPIMDAAIDRLKTGGARIDKSRLFTSLFPQVKGKLLKVHSMALMNLIKAGLGALPNANPQMPAMIPDTAGGIAGYSIRRGDNLIGVTRISLSEIAAVKNAAPMIAGMFTQMMMSGMMNAGGRQPGTVHSRCVNNLRMIDAAKEQCAMERDLNDGDNVDPDWLKDYLRGGKLPTCPASGKYTINPIGEDPECSIPGHSLQD